MSKQLNITEEQQAWLDNRDEMSSRELSVLTRGSPTGKSSVNDFFRRYDIWQEETQTTSESEQEAAEQEDIEELCNHPDWHVANLAKRLRTAQRTNTQLRKTLNQTNDISSHIPDMVDGVRLATEQLNNANPVQLTTQLFGCSDTVVEVLFSDWQVGKICEDYNSSVAKSRLKSFGGDTYYLISEWLKDHNINAIKLVSLGDICEDHLKHGVQSATSTDSPLSQQIADAIEYIWSYIVEPLATFGIPMEVVCIAGNHGSSQHKGMDMYKAGLYSYDYPIYKALEGYCEVAGYDHVTFTIPEGCFASYNIFDKVCVAEHGYFNSASEKSMEDQRNKRSNQIKKHVDYFRVGDKHHVCGYDCGRLVVNGAFFGQDTKGIEYSGTMGYSAVPAQVVMLHDEHRIVKFEQIQF